MIRSATRGAKVSLKNTFPRPDNFATASSPPTLAVDFLKITSQLVETHCAKDKLLAHLNEQIRQREWIRLHNMHVNTLFFLISFLHSAACE